MAIIHHQFESIHPFSDGNGRIGRILNVLYLTRTGLLDIPILYLSGYITKHKSDYYRLLQGVRNANSKQELNDAWQYWVIYMLTAVSQTSKSALALVSGIREQMATMKTGIRDGELQSMYSQDLINNLFRHPYTRIEYLVNDINVSRNTATKYLEDLVKKGFLTKQKAGRNNYYINMPLVNLLIGHSTVSLS